REFVNAADLELDVCQSSLCHQRLSAGDRILVQIYTNDRTRCDDFGQPDRYGTWPTAYIQDAHARPEMWQKECCIARGRSRSVPVCDSDKNPRSFRLRSRLSCHIGLPTWLLSKERCPWPREVYTLKEIRSSAGGCGAASSAARGPHSASGHS